MQSIRYEFTLISSMFQKKCFHKMHLQQHKQYFTENYYVLYSATVILIEKLKTSICTLRSSMSFWSYFIPSFGLHFILVKGTVYHWPPRWLSVKSHKWSQCDYYYFYPNDKIKVIREHEISTSAWNTNTMDNAFLAFTKLVIRVYERIICR